MATISKRGSYQFQASIRRKGYPTQIKTFETRRDAEAWSRSIESEMDTGRFVPTKEADQTSLYDALTRYAESMEWTPPSFRVVDQPFHSDISMPEQVGASIPLIQIPFHKSVIQYPIQLP